MHTRTSRALAALMLAACGEAELNSGDYVEVLVVNSTGLSGVIVTLRGGGVTATSSVEPGAPLGLGTDIEVAGEPVRFHVELGDDSTDHTCHVHADAIGNPDNVPTAVIYGEPLRVLCQSGWQEEAAE